MTRRFSNYTASAEQTASACKASDLVGSVRLESVHNCYCVKTKTVMQITCITHDVFDERRISIWNVNATPSDNLLRWVFGKEETRRPLPCPLLPAPSGSELR